MILNSFPAPIGFVQEFLVVSNNLNMKEVEIHDGKLLFLPKYNRHRDAHGLLRRLSNRLHITDLVSEEYYYNYSTFAINQDRLGQLIDLRGWPEITQHILAINMNVWQDKDKGYVVEVELDCETHEI